MTNDCPYGASNCPKLLDMNKRVDKLEHTLSKILYIVYFIAGVVSVEFGVVLI